MGESVPGVNGGDAEQQQQQQQLQLPGQATLSPDDPEQATISAAKAGSGEDTRINLEVLTKPDAALGSSPSVSSAPSGALPPSSAALAKPEAPEEDVYVSVTWKELVKQWFIMGWIGFGGPAAHIGLFQRWFVERLKWMSNGVFMEIFALGQCLPGPTSTQVSFAIGTIKKGVLGGLASGALFQYPGAIIMTLLGALAAKWLKNPPGWLSGIVAGVSAVGVALVAVAAKGLLMKLCNRKMTAAIGTLSAGAAIYWSEPWLFPLLILIGGIITIIETFVDLTIAEWKKGAESARHRGARALRHAVLAEWRKIDDKEKDDNGGLESLGFGMKGGAALVALWAAVLVTVLVLARTVYKDEANPLNWFEVFYRIGSIIYGGGQVVLPMIFSDVVKQDCTTVSADNGGTSTTVCVERADTWMTAEQFYAGLGAVQAMPGPLFNFSSYLGAIIAINFGYTFILGAVLAWFGLFSPGVLLMFGVLPYWKRFRRWQLYRRALPGFNAVGVGLILASVFKMTVDVYQISPFPSASLCIGLFGFTAVNDLGLFEPIVVIAGLVLGIIAWAGDLN